MADIPGGPPIGDPIGPFGQPPQPEVPGQPGPGPTVPPPPLRTAANWYDDPDSPGGLRYWDGDAWTEHRHRYENQPARSPSGLVSVRDWFSAWTGAITQNWRSLVEFFAWSVLAGLALGAGAVLIASGFRLELSGTPVPDYEGISTSIPLIVAGSIVLVLALVLSLLLRFSQVHFFYGIHASDGDTAAVVGNARDSMLAVTKRAGRIIGNLLILLAVYLIGIGLLVVLAIFVHPIILLPAIFVLFPLGIWLIPMTGPFEFGLVVGPSGTSPFRQAYRMVKGRWGAFAGRTLLVILCTWAASMASQIVFSILNQIALAAAVGSSPLTFEETFPGSGEMLLEVDGIPPTSLALSDVVHPVVLVALVLLFGIGSGINSAAQTVPTASGYGHLYADGESLMEQAATSGVST